jgi:hypothetical protein
MAVIELVRFRLAPSATEDEVLAADRRAQTEFAYHQPGFVRRTTAHDGDGNWIVVTLWASADDAEAAAGRAVDDGAAAAFVALLDASTLTTSRYETLD